MIESQNKLRIGSIIYQLRHGSAEKKLEVEWVENDVAHVGDLKYNANYQGDKVTLLNQSFWLKESFGTTYVVAKLDNIDRYEREIGVRYIRNTDFSSLCLSEILEIKNKLAEFLSAK